MYRGGPEPWKARHHRFRSISTDNREAISLRTETQTLCFNAATGNAFTMVRAGFAFTMRISPKISFLQALVAGLTRVLIRQRPGKVKIPFFLTSAAPSSARLEMILPATFCLISNSAAKVAAIAPLVMGLPVFMAFMVFMGVGILSKVGDCPC